MKHVIYILLIIAAGMWGYNVGTINPRVVQMDREEVAWNYIQEHCEHMGDATGNRWYECNN